MGGSNGEWSPENYDHKFYGPTRLREALTYSRNVVTVKLVEAMGIDNLMNFAKTVGFEGEMPRNFSIALGSFSITPFEMAMVYEVFASNGMKVKPIFVKYVTDRKGRILESREPEPEQAISPQTSFLNGMARKGPRRSSRRKDRDHKRLQGCLVRGLYLKPGGKRMGWIR
jgi:penicillin-binding protein 1A